MIDVVLELGETEVIVRKQHSNDVILLLYFCAIIIYNLIAIGILETVALKIVI